MKRRGKNKRSGWMAVLLVLSLLAGWNQPAVTVLATQSTIQKIKDAEKDLQGLEQGQKENEKDLTGLKTEKKSLQGQLNNLNEQMTQVSENLARLEQEIADKEQEIVDTQAALEEAVATEKWQYDSMVLRVKAMYERNTSNYFGALLGAGSISELVNVADYFEKIESYDQKKLKEFKENRAFIESEKERLKTEKEELDKLKAEAETEKARVAGLIEEAKNSIGKYSSQISEAEKKALAYEAEIKEKEEDLVALKKQLEEEIAKSRKAANSSWRNISEVSFAESDRYLLANLIYCEAGAEPYDGQVAVGAVVINRVLSSVFPDSVTGVIYQNKQFSPVASGRLALALAENRATESCYRAADEAMKGMTNVGNCVFFRTPVPGLSGINIGGHVFY